MIRTLIGKIGKFRKFKKKEVTGEESFGSKTGRMPALPAFGLLKSQSPGNRVTESLRIHSITCKWMAGLPEGVDAISRKLRRKK